MVHGVGGQQEAVTRDQAVAAPDDGGQAEMPLPGHADHAMAVRAHNEKSSEFEDVQARAGNPTQRGDDPAVAHPAPAVHHRQPDRAARAWRGNRRQQQRPTDGRRPGRCSGGCPS
jgi:hypothetical protein